MGRSNQTGPLSWLKTGQGFTKVVGLQYRCTICAGLVSLKSANDQHKSRTLAARHGLCKFSQGNHLDHETVRYDYLPGKNQGRAWKTHGVFDTTTTESIATHTLRNNSQFSRWRLIQPREATADTTDDDRKQRIEKVNDKMAGQLAVQVLKYVNCEMPGYVHRAAHLFGLMDGNQDQNHHLDDMSGGTSEFHADSLVYFIGLRGTCKLGITGVGELEISAGDVAMLSANLWHFGRNDQQQGSLIQFGYLDRVVELKLQSGAESGLTDAISELYCGSVETFNQMQQMVKSIKANYRAIPRVTTDTPAETCTAKSGRRKRKSCIG